MKNINPSLLPQTHIQSTTGIHWVFGTVCAIGTILGSMVIINRPETQDENLPYLLVLIPATILFFYKAMYPKNRLIFQHEGIWTKEHGMILWKDITRLSIEKRLTTKGITQTEFIIYVANQTQSSYVFDLYELGIYEDELREILIFIE